MALVIAALALGLMSSSIGGSLRAGRLAARTTEAVARARSHLAMVMAEDAPVPGEQEGDDGHGFRWRVRVASLAQASGAALYAVTVWITWPQGAGTSEVRLNSQRLGRPPGA